MDIMLKKILYLLDEKKRQQGELSEFLGLKSCCVTEWKSGKTKSYKKHIDKIAEFFDVPKEYFANQDLESEKKVEILYPEFKSDSTTYQMVEVFSRLSLRDKVRAIDYIISLEDKTSEKSGE